MQKFLIEENILPHRRCSGYDNFAVPLNKNRIISFSGSDVNYSSCTHVSPLKISTFSKIPSRPVRPSNFTSIVTPSLKRNAADSLVCSSGFTGSKIFCFLFPSRPSDKFCYYGKMNITLLRS